jgi:hypothetical protein
VTAAVDTAQPITLRLSLGCCTPAHSKKPPGGGRSGLPVKRARNWRVLSVGNKEIKAKHGTLESGQPQPRRHVGLALDRSPGQGRRQGGRQTDWPPLSPPEPRQVAPLQSCTALHRFLSTFLLVASRCRAPHVSSTVAPSPPVGLPIYARSICFSSLPSAQQPTTASHLTRIQARISTGNREREHRKLAALPARKTSAAISATAWSWSSDWRRRARATPFP